MSNIPYRTHLSEEEIPRYWYNMQADMKEKHDPFIHPGRLDPVVYEDLQPVFCDELIKQEVNTTDRLIEIPEGIREVYKLYRPSPLCRAYNLEKALGTPAKIYYKFEGNNTSGSHKLNSAVAQVYYA
ncbi:MAG: TrpB-like pyridoxal-phosphate dependent enzyme, partial [Eubacteriales bacterium]|nr:TrpB-like pyridoxal-phosphate dependent enzyme [Eubacteriales bacterium]